MALGHLRHLRLPVLLTESTEPPLPIGPLTRRTRNEPTGNPTYPNLLEDEHDEALFEHYTLSQMAELAEGQSPILLGRPAIYESISLSPDGRHILATHLERPFSFITGYRRFPRTTVVMDRRGTVMATLDEQPLQEARNRDGDDAEDGPRAFAWRPDGTGIGYLEREPQDPEEEDDTPQPDRVMLLEPPFDRSKRRPDPVGDLRGKRQSCLRHDHGRESELHRNLGPGVFRSCPNGARGLPRHRRPDGTAG